MFKKNWSWPWKSRVDFISFINFVLKTTSMYFDVTFYYYYAKLTFFSGCAHEKSEVINWSQKIDHFCLKCWPSCLSWTSYISHFNSASDSPLQELSLAYKIKVIIVIFIVVPPFSIFMFIDPFFFVVIQIFVRFCKLALPLVWKRFSWFIPSFSFLSCVKILYIVFFMGVTKSCTHIHPAPSTSIQLISASPQLHPPPSSSFQPPPSSLQHLSSFSTENWHTWNLGGADSESELRFLKFRKSIFG